VVQLKEILDRSFGEHYGVAAFNVFNDLTLEAVLAAATELESPVIVQTSLKTVRTTGPRVLYRMFRAMAEEVPIPVTLHLDHCPDREWITTCLQTGWNSVLFDGSHLDIEENTRQTREVVAEAAGHGAQVEGEIESVAGVEDDVGSDEEAFFHPVELSIDFIERTGIYSFAPAIGTAHGMYTGEPDLKPERVTEILEKKSVPMVLHGGTGLDEAQFRDLISRGCAKVNISTAIRVSFMETNSEFLNENPANTHDPASLLAYVGERVKDTAARHIRMFGSAGKSWTKGEREWKPRRPGRP
jgi:ketose-bisphosphate aldolase